jgi:mannose-6-phosphate isomerase-like protein (cupin superfamily)
MKKINPVDAPNFTMNAAELFNYLPKDQKFNIKRIYWLTDPKGEKKSGQHAHTDEDEIFVTIKGEATLLLDLDGKGIKKIVMDQNSIIWVPRLSWHGFEGLSDDCVILALTSTNYDPERKGYVTDYQNFKDLKSK